MKKFKKVTLWVLRILLGLFFTNAGYSKFGRWEMWSGRFEGWGYPHEFTYVIGILEIAAGILLFIPRTSAYSSLVLIATMLGASITHFYHGEPGIQPIIFAIILLGLFLLKTPDSFKRMLKRP